MKTFVSAFLRRHLGPSKEEEELRVQISTMRSQAQTQEKHVLSLTQTRIRHINKINVQKREIEALKSDVERLT